MSDANKNLEIKARRALKPPFTHERGYIYDANGDMVADNGGLRVRGWGRLGELEDGAEIQDAIGDRIAEILTQNWDYHPSPKPKYRR